VSDRQPDRSSSERDRRVPDVRGEDHRPDAGASADAAPLFEIDQELVGIFVGEALEHLGSIEASVLALEESADDADALDEVFRLFHTLKGSAGALGFAHIHELAHTLEDLLHRARAGEHTIGAREVEIVFAAIDLLTRMVNAAQGRQPETTVGDLVAERRALQDAIAQLLDGGAGIGDARAEAERTDDDEIGDQSAKAETPSAGAPIGFGPVIQPTIGVDTRKLDTLVDLIGELVIAQSMIQQQSRLHAAADEPLNRTLAHCQRLTHEVHQGAMTMRLVPIRRTFQRMHRLLRDLSRRSGKAVDLTLSGEETELDRKVVDEMAAPLMHMLRNSVDHGIEDADTRSRAGKPRRGQLSLSAFHQSGSIVIEVSDDGRGLDTDALYERAVASGLIERGARPSDPELHALIFRTGFSTAERVTDLSGRGVGMDVVRRTVESLRGRIEIRSRRGVGTTFVVKLPLTLATIEGLLLGVGGQRFVLPTFAVQESLQPSPDRLRLVAGQGWLVEVRDELVPVMRLADLLDLPALPSEPTDGVLVVVDDDGRRLALGVDELLGKQNLVIKSLGEAFADVDGVAGGAILGDGRIGLILDAGGLIRLSDRGRVSHAA
jgi:two-component system, chemotaxis family, sensor kinase CheA